MVAPARGQRRTETGRTRPPRRRSRTPRTALTRSRTRRG
eukprot:jgi/Chrpa1/22260/Chrysochromulina_OHIO_Genome00024163-RA